MSEQDKNTPNTGEAGAPAPALSDHTPQDPPEDPQAMRDYSPGNSAHKPPRGLTPEQAAEKYPVRVRSVANAVKDEARRFIFATGKDWRTTEQEASRLEALGQIERL